MTEAEELHTTYIVNCVVNAFLSYTAITLNSVTIHALRKTSSLPKHFKTLLLSLAVSDLGVGLLVQPLHIAILVMELQPNKTNGTAFKTTYIALSATVNFLASASFIGVMALSADSFFAVYLHLRYHEIVTQKRVVAGVFVIWVLSAFLPIIRLGTTRDVSYAIFTAVIVFCLLTTTLLNYKIYVAVRHQANQIQALQVQQEAQNGEMANAARLRKFAFGTFFIYITFMVCYLPNTCRLVIFMISGTSTTMNVLRYYAMTLIFLNSSLNPLIYCWKMRHIRHAVMNILRKMLRSHN